MRGGLGPEVWRKEAEFGALEFAEESVDGVDGGAARLTEGYLAAVVEDDSGGAAAEAIAVEAEGKPGVDGLGGNGFPVSGDEVPGDGG